MFESAALQQVAALIGLHHLCQEAGISQNYMLIAPTGAGVFLASARALSTDCM
jgi:hypothetical protein